MAAVSELETEYEGQIVFTIIQPEYTKASGEVEAYELGTHGLVAFGPDGQVIATLPGHQFGKPEIEEVIRKLLGDA